MKSPQRTTSLVFYLAVLLVTGFGESLHAQLTRPVTSSRATAPEVQLSELSSFGNRDNVAYQILPYDDDFFVSTYQQGRNINSPNRTELLNLRLYRYNDRLERTGEVQIGWPDEARDHLGLRSLGNALLWTFMTAGRERNTFDVRAEVLDGTGKLVEQHQLLTVHQRELAGLADFEAYSASRDYYVRAYADESNSSLFSKRDDERATITLAVFDRQGSPVTLERQRLRVTRDQLEIQSVAVDESGQAFVLAKVYAGTKGRETRRGSDSKVYLYTLTPGADKLERTELKLAGQYIEGISMVPGIGGQPAIVGIYSDRLNGRINGYFSSSNPTAGEVLKPEPFSFELLDQLGRRVTTRRRGELMLESDYTFGDALRLSDGRLSILFESIRITQNNAPTSIGFGVAGAGVNNTGGTTYTFREGLMLTFAADGNLDEALLIPAFQSYTDQGVSGRFRNALARVPPYYRMRLLEYAGKPATIYNDNPKNFGRDPGKNPRALRFRDALATLAYADDSGRLTQQPLFGRRDADRVILIPASAERLGNDEVVFLATRYRSLAKNQLRFGLLSP